MLAATINGEHPRRSTKSTLAERKGNEPDTHRSRSNVARDTGVSSVKRGRVKRHQYAAGTLVRQGNETLGTKTCGRHLCIEELCYRIGIALLCSTTRVRVFFAITSATLLHLDTPPQHHRPAIFIDLINAKSPRFNRKLHDGSLLVSLSNGSRLCQMGRDFVAWSNGSRLRRFVKWVETSSHLFSTDHPHYSPKW